MSEEKVLPPMVYGKLRGHLTVKIDEIFWVKSSPGSIFVELQWWGEKESNIFKPTCINHPGNTNDEDTSITFNIRTSLPLFENYIKKLGKLTLGVFNYTSREHIGDVIVWNLHQTVFSGEFKQGYYPVFNKNKSRIGDVRISFELWMAKKDVVEVQSDLVDFSRMSSRNSKNEATSISSSRDADVVSRESIREVVNRGKELRDAMTMSVLEDTPLDNIDKVMSYNDVDNEKPVKSSQLIDANKLVDFLKGKELPPDEVALAINTLRSVSPSQSAVNEELKQRVSSAQSCQPCFKNINSCSSCTSRNFSSSNSNSSRPQTSSSGVLNQRPTNRYEDEAAKTKHIIELVNCFKLVVQCLHLNSLGIKKVKGTTKAADKGKKKPGLYYMIEHIPATQTNVDKDKPWTLKQKRFVSRKINDNEIIFGESNNLVEAINGNFSWPQVLKQVNGTILKVYYRYYNQRLPSFLGSVTIKDDSITPSGLFSTFTLAVISNSGITIGHLSLLLELGHNRKTFGSQLLSCSAFKNENKMSKDEKEINCDCNVCKTGGVDRYDEIWGREMERRARNLMISSHHQCCQSACNKNTGKSVSTDNRPIESRDAKLTADNLKSTGSSDSEVSNKNEPAVSDRVKLIELPTNLPESLKSDSSESSSLKSDSVNNDLRLDRGNARPKSTTDASCQVTLERSPQTVAKEHSNNARLCKSCLALNYRPDPYRCNSSANAFERELPSWTRREKHVCHACRDNSHDNHYKNYSCRCGTSEMAKSHKCCYDIASAQMQGTHYYHPRDHIHHVSSPEYTTRDPYLLQEPMTIHEFCISVDKIIDFPMFSRDLNKDADCFVDYTFPINQNNRVVVPHRRYSTEVSMISDQINFSTATRHTLTLPSCQDLDRVFTSVAFPSLDFNVWCRFYRSTPVDHVIAKAILPIGRICALKQEFEELGGLKSAKDKVCIPLLTVASPLSVQYPTKISGYMEVTLIYKNFRDDVPTLDRSTLNSRSDRRNDGFKEGETYKHSSNHCCNNINYNTVRSSSEKNFSKTDVSSNNCSESKSKCNKEKIKEDRALSPIQELSNSDTPRDQIEHLRQSLERLVVEAESLKCKPDKTNDIGDDNSSADSYMENCRNVIQLESSSDEGLDSIVPTVKPDIEKNKNKTRNETNKSTGYHTSKKGNPRSDSLDSDNLETRLNQNFDDVQLSDDNSLKSVSSVNSDDSSSHAGFIAFNKDFVKNDCKMRSKETRNDSPRSFNRTKKTSDNKASMTSTSKCTQTGNVATAVDKEPSVKIDPNLFFNVRIEVERAINLPAIAPYGSVSKQKPSSYVSMDAFVNGKSEHLASEIVYNSTDPVWNASWNVMLPTEYLYKCDKRFVLNVMLLSHAEDVEVGELRKDKKRRGVADPSLLPHTSPVFKHSDRPNGAVRKQALIDLTSLCAGLRLIFGWYSLVNDTTPCSGQIMIKITPLEDISKYKSAWFKEYIERQKNRHRPMSNPTPSFSSKTEEFKMKRLMDNIESKASSQTPPARKETKKSDSIDRDLVYISLNQKLSELDKIPLSFKNDRFRYDYCRPSTSSGVLSETHFAESFNQKRDSISSKDLSDLNIDKDINYVNKLLSEIPLFKTRTIDVNCEKTPLNDDSVIFKFGGSEEMNPCDTEKISDSLSLRGNSDYISSNLKQSNLASNNYRSGLKNMSCFPTIEEQSEGSGSRATEKPREAVKRRRDYLDLDASFNASDILDLEELKSRKTDYCGANTIRNNPDFNYNFNTAIPSGSDSKSDDKSKSDPVQSQYQSLSPELSLEKTEDLDLPSEYLQGCSGPDSQACVFNNRNSFKNYCETGEFRRYSPPLTTSDAAPQTNKGYSELPPLDKLSDDETVDGSKGIETLSGQSSLCTDDQSLNYSDPQPSHGAYQNNSSDNNENLNSDLIEEASSEIDRILREMNKR